MKNPYSLILKTFENENDKRELIIDCEAPGKNFIVTKDEILDLINAAYNAITDTPEDAFNKWFNS